jgi:hypothetical protein
MTLTIVIPKILLLSALYLIQSHGIPVIGGFAVHVHGSLSHPKKFSPSKNLEEWQ